MITSSKFIKAALRGGFFLIALATLTACVTAQKTETIEQKIICHHLGVAVSIFVNGREYVG